ncbi:helix-turn-helix domain-containing protein [Antrihabitans stalactiti]|nr:helix-turn-helix transcriptional regulator [Antrihabitans stalactiti]
MEQNLAPTPLSELLKRLRDERGLSLYALAQVSGIDRGNLRRIETGAISNLTPATMQKLADALEVDVEDFYAAHFETTGQPLPSLPVYFRTKHQSLSDEQIAEIDAYVRRIEESHRMSGNLGPRNGEDE